ncbi:hypothetical protein [Streptosporangium sp. KLBMP 9127]|nr:hypothetical protein [Streptosporangium sp. KLBMP 9127]
MPSTTTPAPGYPDNKPGDGPPGNAQDTKPLFAVVSLPHSDYATPSYPPLPADACAARVEETLTGIGGDPVAWPVPAGGARDFAAVTGRLQAWTRSGRPLDGSVLFWAGHGSVDDQGAWLAIYDSPDPMRLGGIDPVKIADFVITEWIRHRQEREGAWAIVVIEACGGARFADLVAAELIRSRERPIRCAVLGVGAPDGAGELGAFAAALDGALAAYLVNDVEIKPEDLLRQLRDRLEYSGGTELELYRADPIRRPARVLPTAVSATMEVYTQLLTFIAALPADQRSHFLAKAQGAELATAHDSEQSELAWYFVGRHAERARIAVWLRTKNTGMLVVTGRAGSGKSALLGHVLVHTTPPLRDLLIAHRLLTPAPAGEFPPQSGFDSVIHLTGMNTATLIERLAADTGLGRPPAGTGPGGDVEWLLTGLADRTGSGAGQGSAKRPFTLLADALDEAEDPISIAGSVLRRVAALPGVRVVAGTRSSTREGPDLPDTADEDLLDALGRTAELLRVERDPQAVGEYVRLRLATARDQGYLAATDAAVTGAATLIQGMNRQFLYARLAVYEIIAAPHLLAPEFHQELRDLLEQDHRALFTAAVDRLTRDRPATRPLLEALALSRGRGLPRTDGIWTIVATALNHEHPVTELDIDHLLHQAAPYVMLDAEAGQSVYRLAHRTFAEHFLTGPGAYPDPGSG